MPASTRPATFQELHGFDGDRALNFNSIGAAPEVPAIRREVRSLLRAYSDRVPGSAAASAYLRDLADECRELLAELLLTPADRDRFAIELYPGTCRALEVSLSRIPGLGLILLSPFEHPTVLEVARWHGFVVDSEVDQVRFDPSDYFAGAEAQVDRVVGRIVERVSGRPGVHALILSEVSYTTGLIIPAAEILRRLEERMPPPLPRVIIDGAHSIGNERDAVELDGRHDYVFSGHKWLLAPEPCGILLSRATRDRFIPYDSWSGRLPLTTASARVVAGLLAGLRLLNRVGLEGLRAHSRRLRERFLERLSPRLSVVGRDSGLRPSSMLAVCPAPGARWRYEYPELQAYLDRQSVRALVVSLDPDTPWVRLAFTHCNDGPSVASLCEVLEAAVTGP